MEHLDGILAVAGFWLFWILVLMKKPFMAYLEARKTLPNKEVETLSERVLQLESVIGTLTKDMLEMKDTTEFAQKLLTDSSLQVSSLSQRLTKEGVLEAGGASGGVKTLTKREETPASQIKLVTTDDARLPDMGTILNEHAVRFERLLPATPEKVWEYLTDPQQVKQWLAAASIEPRIGGRIELKFDVDEMPERKEKGANIHGLIGWYEPQRGVSYSWIDDSSGVESVVAFELTPKGNQTLLVVTHSRLPKSRMHEFMAGWHAHLDVLIARLSNLAPPDFRKRFNQLIAVYASVVIAFFVAGGPTQAASMSASAGATAYQTIQTERNQLLKKYDQLRKDTDDLQRRVDMLKRDTTQEANNAADQLDSQLQNEYRDLRDLELQIRDLDTAMR
jgi:uncharacterized protein YndB with AHSA1/START domain/cell division protein FtsB